MRVGVGVGVYSIVATVDSDQWGVQYIRHASAVEYQHVRPAVGRVYMTSSGDVPLLIELSYIHSEVGLSPNRPPILGKYYVLLFILQQIF